MDRNPRAHYFSPLARFRFMCPHGVASTPVTARLAPAATEDALRLLLDDGEADARAAASAAASCDGLKPPPPSSRGKRKLPTTPGLGKSEATSLAPPSSKLAAATAATAAAVAAATEVEAVAAAAAGSPLHGACAVGQQEGGPGVDEGPRWRLWHKGEVRSEWSACGRVEWVEYGEAGGRGGDGRAGG